MFLLALPRYLLCSLSGLLCLLLCSLRSLLVCSLNGLLVCSLRSLLCLLLCSLRSLLCLLCLLPGFHLSLPFSRDSPAPLAGTSAVKTTGHRTEIRLLFYENQRVNAFFSWIHKTFSLLSLLKRQELPQHLTNDLPIAADKFVGAHSLLAF